MTYRWEIDSPVGTLTLASNGRALTGVFFPIGTPPVEADAKLDPRPFDAALAWFHAYFSREVPRLDVAVEPKGTAFQQKVWAALREIPYGETRSYKQVADAIGQPTAVRAVGAANGRNPIAILVPCHRVIGSTGDLVGYGGGPERKRWLLDHEAGRTSLFG